MSFETINTQEEFDAKVKARIDRINEKYKDFMSPEDVQKLKNTHAEELKSLNSKIEGYTSPEDVTSLKQGYETKISDLTKQNESYKLEKMRYDAAYKFNVPREMANRLQGNDVESLEKDAQLFAQYAIKNQVAPLSNTDDHEGEKNTSNLFKGLLNDLSKE